LGGERGRAAVQEFPHVVEVIKGSKDSTVISNGGPRIPSQKLVRMYRSNMDDLKWAGKGVVATVINGEAISLVQQRIKDIGFKDLDIIPMGADKVFIHSLSEEAVISIIDRANHFFHHFFSLLF